MNALSKPWIVPYLISCANTYGNEAWPPVAKPRTIQIVKFLTGPTPKDPEPTTYWAEISDYESHISAWISSDAVSSFYKLRGCRLSSVQTGVFVIRSYKPLLTKAPPGPGYASSWTLRLVLEIMEVELLGSEREPPFGSPKPAIGHPGIQKWIAQGDIRSLQRRSPATEKKKSHKVPKPQSRSLSPLPVSKDLLMRLSIMSLRRQSHGTRARVNSLWTTFGLHPRSRHSSVVYGGARLDSTIESYPLLFVAVLTSRLT